MPEGDTVHRAARRLDAALSGRVLTAADLRVPRHATADLVWAEVLATVPRGKHLLTRLRVRGEDLTLHTHLKMEGVWRVHRAGARWQRPGHTARVVLEAEQDPNKAEPARYAELGHANLSRFVGEAGLI